ncbi:MAG: ABC transporter permease subunit [Chloroflexi bacterium]|nr:ABC transporter permease subunit [Chloroflexota bacterium]
MTSSTGAEPRQGREGRVFDLGYQRYEGQREGRWRARKAVYVDGLRIALGIGRGGRAKILPWLFVAVAIAVGLIFALNAGAVDRVVGEGAAEAADLPSHSDYYAFGAILLFLFAAVVGPELLCPDRHNRVINLYLVRPITSIDYVAARFLAFLTIMLVVAWLPQIVLLAGLAFGASQPGDYLVDNWQDIPKFLAAGAAIAVYTTSMGLAVAAFTTRRGYASVGLVGLFVISQFAAGILGEVASGATGEWLALISLSDVPLHINEIVFDTSDTLGGGQAARGLPTGVRVAAFFAFTLAAMGVLWNRYRRLTV